MRSLVANIRHYNKRWSSCQYTINQNSTTDTNCSRCISPSSTAWCFCPIVLFTDFTGCTQQHENQFECVMYSWHEGLQSSWDALTEMCWHHQLAPCHPVRAYSPRSMHLIGVDSFIHLAGRSTYWAILKIRLIWQPLCLLSERALLIRTSVKRVRSYYVTVPIQQ